MQSEDSDQSYYPSAKVRLIIRFEELGTNALEGKAPTKTTPRLNGTKDERAPLVVQSEVDSFDGIRRFVLVAAGSTEGPKPTASPAVSQDGFTHEITGIVPHSASWKLNGIRAADTLSLALRYVDFPFHPALIRAVAVEFYLGTLTAEEYAAGVSGQSRGDVFGRGVPNAGEPMNLVPDTYLDSEGRQRTNLRFQGWLDKPTFEVNDEGIALVNMSCTDNTRLLIKQPCPPKLVLAMDVPIDEAVAQYLSHFPQMEGLRVEYQPSSEPRTATNPPRLKDSLGPTAFRPHLGPPPSKGGGATDSKLSVFDYITDACGAIGHIVYVDGVNVVIRRPRTLLGGEAQAREDDPYRTRHLESGDYPVRTFIFGRNVKSMKWSRDMGTEKEPKNIEVRCYSPRRKNTLVARWPTKEARLTTSLPGDEKAEQEWRVITVSGIENEATLLDIAQSYYESGNRNEITVDVKTENIASFGGDNEDPDILDVRAGDTVQMLVDRGDATGTVNEREDELTSPSGAEKRLLALGYSQELASFYGNLYAAAGLQKFYRIREGEFTWDPEKGVSISLNCANYVEVRVNRDQDATAGAQPTAPKTSQGNPSTLQQGSPPFGPLAGGFSK